MKKIIWAFAVLGLLITGWVIAQEEEQELKIEQAVIAKDVDQEKREPVEPGDKFSAEVGKVYCFIRVTGAKGETEIKMAWYLGDKVVSEIPLKVKASTWRTWSYKTIDPATMKGAWKVEIKDAGGKILTTLNFTIE